MIERLREKECGHSLHEELSEKCRLFADYAAGVAMLILDNQDANIQMEEDETNIQNFWLTL